MAKNIKRIVLAPPEKCYNELNDYDTCIGERVYKVNNTIRDYVAHHFEEALQSGCITVCYEPILRALTGKICAFEALARWHDPEQGEIRPCDFIPVLEQENNIHLLDYFVTKATIEGLHSCRQQGLPIVPIVINLSRRDFLLSDPIGVLNHLTENYELPHIYLQVEITKTAFVRDEETIVHAIQRLRASGYTVTLDNFGEDHSLLAALQRCAIDEISLDKIFFENFTKSSRLLLTSILLMAKTLSIHTAAEGVQTEEQAEFLRGIGCEKIQGPVCRPHATPVDQLQILQQAQAPYLESLLEQQVFQQAGLTNLVTLPDRDKLISTVMAFYGFTNLPADQESPITDAALWRTLTQFSHRKLFWKDREGRFCGASPAFLRYYGLQNTNELIGKTDKDLGWHLSNLEMDQTEKCVLEHGEPVHDGQGHCIARGRQHAISFSKYPIYQGTEIVGLLGELRDVEEERNYHKLQRKLYLIDEETDFYNYRGMILASVEFADNLRLSRVNYTGAMLVIPEFASIAKLYGPSVRRAVLRRICAVIRKNMPASVVAAHTGRATFVLFLKNQSVGTMRRFIEQIRTDLTTITEVDGFACHFSMRYALESGTEARTSDEFLKILSSRCLDYLPSYGVTGMIGDQVPFDIEKFDHVNRLIYIADAETYDLLYVNPCLLRSCHLPMDYQYAGQKCYQLFNGTSSPCTSCPKDNLRRDRFHFRTFHSLRNSRDYHIWSTLVSWNNHSCIFTDALDVKRMMDVHDADKLTEQFNVSVNDITSIAIQEEDPNVGIQRMMEKLGRTLSATHIILMEEESDGFHLSCTYEWHAEDCAPLRQCLQHTTILENKPFYDAFHRSPVLLVDNAAVYQERHPELATIHQGELERYALGQLMIEHRSLGYIAIINPAKEGFAAITKPLHTILRISSIMMRNRDNIQKLYAISTVDQLTGVGNRRALNNFVDKCLRPGTMYAVIFIDVNELKKMNDTFGHARGDLLIQTIAYVLSNVAGKNHVFRLGGDEFLAIMPCQDDTEAVTLLDHIEQDMHTHHCSAALGYVLCLAPFSNLDALIHKADEKMYRDKKEKHMRREDG